MKTLIINDEDYEEVVSYLHESNIRYTKDTYEALLTENVEYYMDNIISQDNWVDKELQVNVRDLDENELDELKEKAVDYLLRNEYLSQTINECTEESISIESQNIIKNRIFVRL